MIVFNHVYKTYPGPTHALRDLNLEVARGEFVFLTGASGSGKTTFFNLLTASDRATSGSVVVHNTDVNALTPSSVHLFRRKVGVIYQDFKLIDALNVFENIALPLRILGQSDESIRAKVYEMIGRIGLVGKLSAKPFQLSGGEQQRVAIARALIHTPDLLVADEPTGNLDPDLTEVIMDLLESANKEASATVLVATHDHELVKRRGHRVLHIHRGVLEN